MTKVAGSMCCDSTKPSIIHIMVGSEYWDDDASYNLVTAELENGPDTGYYAGASRRHSCSSWH